MSSRALRKAQREREEQERLQRLDLEVDDSGDDGAVSTQPGPRSAFAMLEEDDGQDDDADEDDEPDRTMSKNGLPDRAMDASLVSSPNPAAKNRKKKRKKKAAGGKTESSAATAEAEKDNLDDIDRALKELSTSDANPASGATVSGLDGRSDEVFKLLAIDSNHLHAQNEMRRLFGRAALDQNDEEHPPQNAAVGGNRRQQRRAAQVGLAQALRGTGGAGGRGTGLAAMALRRNMFIQGKDDWPAAGIGGLGMEIEEKRADGTILYRFIHNRVYQDVQAQFEMAVESMDPNRLVVLLQHNPYHISTLLQVSEIAKQERDHATSGDLLERALFSFGRALHSTFAKSVGEGKARLDFKRLENREFWLAAWRYMQNLGMRGTWRTVYEWAKLLLSLSPKDDPYAIWLALDQYALRARQDLDFLNLSRNTACQGVHKNLPNIQLSQGLAEFRAGNQSKGRQGLFRAVGRFPWIVARLMQEAQLDPPPEIWGKEPRTETERLYAELYVKHTKDLWIAPEISSLLMEVASALSPETKSADIEGEEISLDQARHILLSDDPNLISHVPRRYTAMLQSTSDPLPPIDAYPSYLSAHHRASPHRSRSAQSTAADLTELHGLYNWFSTTFPWFRPNAADTTDGPEIPAAEEVQRRIAESEIDEAMLMQRMRRMREIQERLGAAVAGGNIEIDTDGHELPGAFVEEEQQPQHDENDRRARVEDAADSDDD